MRMDYLVGALAGALLAGCTASSDQVAPPQFDPYYPAGVAVSPDPAESVLFIVNANGDLRYDSGSLQAYDLNAVETVVANPTGNGCSVPANSIDGVPVCPTTVGNGPASFVRPSAIKIGNFASALAVQRVSDSEFRVFSTVRGDPSLTWASYAGGALACGESGDFPRCDSVHRLENIRDDADTFGRLSSEPFNLAVDSGTGRVFVTHLTSGRVSLAQSVPPNDPALEDVISGFALWQPNVQDGSFGAVGVAVRTPGDPDGWIYVSSRAEARIATLRVAQDIGGGLVLVRGPSTLYGGAFEGGDTDLYDMSPGDARSIVFVDDGDRAFVVSRKPPSIVALDTSLDATNVPQNLVIGQVEVCGQPSDLAVIDLDPADPNDGLRGYVPCFATGQVWAFDLDRMTLLDTIDAGRGPAAIAVSATRQKLYVANYADDTIAVIDIEPGSPTEHHTLARLGQPRAEND